MISVIVVDYNGGKVTEDCVKSICASTYSDYELIVVDNYATKQFYAEGLNEGIRRSKGDVIICCSNDIVVREDWLTHIADAMKDEKIGIANPMIFDNRFGEPFATVCKINRWGIPYEGYRMWVEKIDVYGPQTHRRKKIYGVPDYANGCCMVIRKEALDRVGLFDEKFKIFYDDVDMALRIRREGYKVAVIEKAIVWHKGGDTIKKRSFFTNKRRHIHDVIRFLTKKMKGYYG